MDGWMDGWIDGWMPAFWMDARVLTPDAWMPSFSPRHPRKSSAALAVIVTFHCTIFADDINVGIHHVTE